MMIFQVMGFNPRDVGLVAHSSCAYLSAGFNALKQQKLLEGTDHKSHKNPWKYC